MLTHVEFPRNGSGIKKAQKKIHVAERNIFWEILTFPICMWPVIL